MTKTTGERIVEGWKTEIVLTGKWSSELNKVYAELSRRIDEALATAEGEVERLREVLLKTWDHDPDCPYRWQEGDCNCCEALAQKE